MDRNYLQEAQAILEGSSRMLPERIHLLALNLAHKDEMIRLIHEMSDKVTRALTPKG